MQYKSKNNLLATIMVSLMVAFIFSCGGNKPQAEVVEENYDDTSLDDFAAFYERFHADSQFQLERITFPLEGLPGMADSVLIEYGTFQYHKKGWKILHAVDWDTTTMFQRKLEDTGLGAINEYICTYDKFCISRRFAKLSDGWYMIYYADINYRPDLF